VIGFRRGGDARTVGAKRIGHQMEIAAWNPG
jgi:hypothetical protein